MRYTLACLLEGPAADYQQRLIREIADRFDLRFTQEQAIPPHFTLKYEFDTDAIDTVEGIVRRFCATHTKAAVEVGGFGEFPPDVAFLKVQLSPAAQTLFEEFLTELREIPWMVWSPYDGVGLQFHATLVERCGPKLPEVRQFLEGQEKWFSCWLDNITFFVQTGAAGDKSRWSIHRRFAID
jgi:2'-5' RNA ligase